MASATAQSTWDARIARARELASSRPGARDLLNFYAALAEYQRALAASAREPEGIDVDRVIAAIPGFLAWLRMIGKADVAAAVDIDSVASGLQGDSPLSEGDSPPFPRPEGDSPLSEGDSPPFPRPERGTVRLGPAERFVLESLLQVFAEQPPARTPQAPDVQMRCPRCAGLPVAAVLREESHGAKRSLLCALCLHEWACSRIVCPACGEQEFDKLPVYTAEQFAHVRIDACDRCHRYIKTIDLTKDGLAVPCVDDIASVPLDLWARERGYTRIKRNVLGI